MSSKPVEASALLARAAQAGVRFIDLQFTDIAGGVKGLTIPTSELPEALTHGVWFDGSSVESYARIAENDLCLAPDPATFSVVPWLSGEQATGRLICSVQHVTGEPFAGDPRGALVRALGEAAQMGYGFDTSPEVEFFLLRPAAMSEKGPQPFDSAGYFDGHTDLSTGWLGQVVATLGALAIAVESLHHEVAPGQLEIDFCRAGALITADNLATFRFVLTSLAQKHGLAATLLPKPFPGLSGSGMHVHQSLAYKVGGQNAFFDPGDSHGLSETARHFIAGQLAHAPALCAVLAPLVNSYQRLAGGYEAPVQIAWARVNRAALIRIPRAHLPQATRIELRCPDSGCNPYLALAVMLAAGLDGVRSGLPVPPAADENLFRPGPALSDDTRRLPRSLEEALEALEGDGVIRAALGEPLYESFVAARRLDIAEHRHDNSAAQSIRPWPQR